MSIDTRVGFVSAVGGATLRPTHGSVVSRRSPALLPRLRTPWCVAPRRPALCMEMSLESSGSSNLSPDPSARQRNAVAAEAKSVLHRCPIYFVGCMGCGKSAVAKYAAFELGYRFLDTDELVEAVGGKSVSELFAEHGEQAFRDLETTILDQVQAYRATCVATGGGIVLRDANWARMQTGIVVWLDAHPTVLARRLDGDETRPLLAGCASMEAKAAKLGEILEARRVRYQQADIRIPISEDQPVDNISTEVLRCLSNFIKENPPRFKSKQDELYPKDTPRQPSRDGG